MDAVFTASVRPDPETGECPEGKKRCSEVTSRDNTVCINEKESLESCPITSLHSFTENDYWNKKFDKNYNILPGPLGLMYLAFSRRVEDKPPVG